jgi:hypothetical protein
VFPAAADESSMIIVFMASCVSNITQLCIYMRMQAGSVPACDEGGCRG